MDFAGLGSLLKKKTTAVQKEILKVANHVDTEQATLFSLSVKEEK